MLLACLLTLSFAGAEPPALAEPAPKTIPGQPGTNGAGGDTPSPIQPAAASSPPSVTPAVPFPHRETVAGKLRAFSEADKSFLVLFMEDPRQDDQLIEGLHRHLDLATGARFLTTLKLEQLGEWLGSAAPARLQIRVTEAAKSSQHPAYLAFKAGLTRSGGLERAYPRA